MPTPDFILELRERIGHMPLWLIGVTGYVRRDDGLVLLEQRTDNGKWTLVTGINEPGEEPADTVAREAKEETGVDVIVTDLVSVKSDRRMITYANGDQAQYMDHLFLCEVAPGVVLSQFTYGGRQWNLVSKSGGFGAKTLFYDLQNILERWKKELPAV